MDRIEQRINELEQRLNNRLDRALSTGTILVLLIPFILIVLGSFIWLRANNSAQSIEKRVANLESATTVTSSRSITGTLSQQTVSDEIIASLDARLSSLETLQEAIVSTSKGALEQMNFTFLIVTAVFGLFSVFFAYRQISADSSREKHDEETLKMVGTARENIVVINDLISSLKESYSYRDEVDIRIQKLNQQLLEVEKYKSTAESNLQNKIIELNERIFDFFCTPINRENFKLEENRGKLENFYVSMNALEQTENVATRFSPFCHFLKALHFFNVTQYDLARTDLEESSAIGIEELTKPTQEWYGKTATGEGIIEQLNRMLTDCTE